MQKYRSVEGLNFLWLEITPSCNLHCKHCYTKSSPFLKDPEIVDWYKVLVDARSLGCKMVQFIGGEPTYQSKLLDYIKTAYHLGYTFIEVYTNLTLMTDEFADEFVKYRVNVATSFYSAHEEIHDNITGVKGSFRMTVDGIKKVLSKKLTLRIGIVTTDLNKSDIDASRQFLLELGVDKNRIKVDRTRPVGRGENLTPYESLGETLCGKCGQGKLTVSWDGNCYPCVFSRMVHIGNISTRNLSEIVSSKELRDFRTFINNYKKKPSRLDCQPASPSLSTEDCYPDNCDPNCTPSCDPNCEPETCSPCNPNCIPNCTPSCHPDCEPNCGPNTDPDCNPYCTPGCMPSQCDPQSCDPDCSPHKST